MTSLPYLYILFYIVVPSIKPVTYLLSVRVKVVYNVTRRMVQDVCGRGRIA